MRAVFRILRLALGGEGRLGEVAGEQQSRQQEGGAQSGVEKRDEPVRATPLDRSQMPPVIITAMMMKDFTSKNLRKKCSFSS